MRVAERTSPYVRDTAGFEHVSPARPAVPNTARLTRAGLRVAAVRLLDGGRTAIPMTMKRAGEDRGDSRQVAPHAYVCPRRHRPGGVGADSRLLLVSPNARGLAARRDAGIPKSQSASGAGL